MQSSSFFAHHSAWGAYATFTLGRYGRGGGFSLSDVHPAGQNVFIGHSRPGEGARLLPFYQGSGGSAGEEAYVMREGGSAPTPAGPRPFSPDEITRTLGWASDAWQAGDLTFRLLTPFGPVPDPGPDLAAAAQADPDAWRFLLAPAVLAELTLDNSRSRQPARLLFALDGAGRVLSDTEEGRLLGAAGGRQWAVACLPGPDVQEVLDWNVAGSALAGEPMLRRLGSQGGLLFTVPAGERRTYTLALATYQQGPLTTGLDLSFAYTRLFDRVEAAAEYALAHQDRYRALAAERDRELTESGLNPDRQFMLAHFTHSYLASTQLMVTPGGEPVWMVNEGEYRMINTFDLTVDQLFWEMRYHPWTTRNVLDLFATRYAYRDRYGLAFTHDMGVANAFSRPGHSSYELPEIDGCFSYMTAEELINWVLCAAHYGLLTGDEAWLRSHAETFRACLASLIARDQNGDGIVDADSDRCGRGSEITTYDSLDASLGQARNNLYLAVKTWAAYLALEHVFRRPAAAGQAAAPEAEAARTAGGRAHLTARSIAARFDPEERFIPAVFEGGNRSRIIPAVEGLIYPHLLGDADAVSPVGRFGPLIQALREHLETVLQPGICLDPVSGGWKLSSTSDNTWMSKIALCQYVAERILHIPADPTCDAVHAGWQHIGCAEQAATDQIWSDSGKDRGSRLYPRLVTAILWMPHS